MADRSAVTGSILASNARLAELEYSLATRPDAALLASYETLISRQYGSQPPPPVWLIRQFLRCLNSGLRDPACLNELADHYEREMSQKYNATLCRLSSLAAVPVQREVYQAVREAFVQGIMEPPRYKATEPTSCKVSIILATRNRPAALRNAISSVLAQTFQDFELLVINDGGSEDAEAVSRSFNSPKIRYFYKKAGGHRTAINLGLQVARGKYIAYLDDDDVFFPEHLETLVGSAEADKLDFVCSRNRWVVGKWEGSKWVETQDLTRQEPFSLERLHTSAVIADLTVLHSRALAERVGKFWEEPLRGGEWEYWVRCSHYVPIRRLAAVTGEVRVLNPTLPLNQPARAAFFTALWRNYFKSAFGHAIVATAAWHSGDAASFEQHLHSMDGHWPYLGRRSLELLSEVGLKCPNPTKRFILLNLAKHHQAWFLKRLATGPHPLEQVRTAASLPLAGYRALLEYAFANRRPA